MMTRRPKNAPFTVQRGQQQQPQNQGYDQYGNLGNNGDFSPNPQSQQQNHPQQNTGNDHGRGMGQQQPSQQNQEPQFPEQQKPQVPPNTPPSHPQSTNQGFPSQNDNQGNEFGADGYNNQFNQENRNNNSYPDFFQRQQQQQQREQQAQNWNNQQQQQQPSSQPQMPPNQRPVSPQENNQDRFGATQSNNYQNPPQYRKSQSQQPPQYRSSQQKPRAEERPIPNMNKSDDFVDHFRVPNAQESSYRESYLNPTYVFETFIEGDCNRLARSAGIAIARKPGATAFNPLVVYGGVGLGKTHLAQAVGNEVKRSDPSKFVLYVSSEQFTTQFIEALRNNNVQQFTNYYLQVDVLIVDDIQFLAKKEKTQENFFHIFNRLHQNGKQIIMTSDRPPRSLEGLTDRLLSRFKWGLTADIQKPDFETRVAIVKQKLMSEGVNVPDDVVEYLSYNIDSNIRELEGTLVSLVANASLMQREVDLDMAKNALLNIVRNTEKEITIEFIQQIVSEYFSISVDELKSKTRKKDIAQARQIAMYFSKEYTKEPLKSIGNQFGGRDHSTVVHATKAVTKRTASDALYNRILEELLDQMNIKSKG
nr:chromosomal replication initiator protein DnaA [Flammeovirga kamogawensis]